MAKRPDVAFVADLSNRLLKARAEAKRLQQEWDALFPIESSDATRPDKADSTVARIITYLDSNVGEGFTAEQVATELGVDNRASIATTLSKLVRKSRIRKFGTDSYQSMEVRINLSTLGLSEDVAGELIPNGAGTLVSS